DRQPPPRPPQSTIPQLTSLLINNAGALVRSGVMFDQLSGQIAALVPEEGWQGIAAQAYAGQTLAQSQHARVMGDLDRLSAGLVASQAEIVKTVRTGVIALMVIVAGTGAVCLYIEGALGPAGWRLSQHIAGVVCVGALTSWFGLLVYGGIASDRNRRSLQVLTQRLTDMMTNLPNWSGPVPALADAAVPPSASTSASDGAAQDLPWRAAGLAEDLGPLPQTTDAAMILAGLPDLPGSPEFSQPSAPSPGFADFGAPHLPIPTLAGMPTTPTGGELAAMNRVTAALGQLNTAAAQQAQMISSLAQQRTGADSTGAAASTSTDERAPVTTATGRTQHHQPRVGTPQRG
ncbi:EspA/EspE family type VII secretion system effector, partial [Mycobacterium pseudoshottsii]|uniref:EspA/EspE family type VII secretion system effector n=1 Tax=Mycobacterium pseudoshottsii TaxID=265949 RepID=UPI001F17E344